MSLYIYPLLYIQAMSYILTLIYNYSSICMCTLIYLHRLTHSYLNIHVYTLTPVYSYVYTRTLTYDIVTILLYTFLLTPTNSCTLTPIYTLYTYSYTYIQAALLQAVYRAAVDPPVYIPPDRLQTRIPALGRGLPGCARYVISILISIV